MAPTPPSTAYLTAGGAVAIGMVAAFFVPEGPWEPISAILGWTVPLLVAVGLTWGRPAAVVAAAAVFVVRIGVHGIAGDRSPGLAVSAVMLVAMIELAARDPELHADLQEWVDRERKGSAKRVWEILTDDYGYDVGYQQVGHHRRGTCGCFK